MLENKIVSVDGIDYEIGALPIAQSIKVLTRVIKILGKSVGKAEGISNIGDVLDSSVDSSITKIIGAFSEQLEEEIVLKTIKELLSQSWRLEGDKKIRLENSFDKLFSGKLFHMFKVVTECFKHNYSDFLDGLPSMKGILKRKEIKN